MRRNPPGKRRIQRRRLVRLVVCLQWVGGWVGAQCLLLPHKGACHVSTHNSLHFRVVSGRESNSYSAITQLPRI